MKNKQEIKENIIKLMNNDLSEKIVDIKMLPASGSSRIYYRIQTEDKTYIATYNSNIEENIAFLDFSKHFSQANLPVPEIISVNDEKDCYIQSDLGDTSLFNYVQNCVKNNSYDNTTIELYKQAISNLVDFQIKGNKGGFRTCRNTTGSPVFQFHSFVATFLLINTYFLTLSGPWGYK